MTASARSLHVLYVYYRVARADLARAVAAAQSMQAGLCARYPGLQGQVLRRVDAAADAADDAAAVTENDGVAAVNAEDTVTLMEVYTAANGVDEALEAEIEAAAARLGPKPQAGARHLERFEPCG